MENKQSYAKTLLKKPIVKPAIKIKATMKPYLYAAAVLKRECMTIADPGNTSYFLQIQSKYVDKRETNDGIQVKLHGGTIIISTHKALLDIPKFPMKIRRAHLFPDIK